MGRRNILPGGIAYELDADGPALRREALDEGLCLWSGQVIVPDQASRELVRRIDVTFPREPTGAPYFEQRDVRGERWGKAVMQEVQRDVTESLHALELGALGVGTLRAEASTPAAA